MIIEQHKDLLQEAKDNVAKKNNYNNWKEIWHSGVESIYVDEVAIEYASLVSKSKWIDIYENPPEIGSNVILLHNYGDSIVYNDEVYSEDVAKFLKMNSVTHYLLLPPNP